MANETDGLVNEILGMLGDNPQEKISELLKGVQKPDSISLPAKADDDIFSGIDLSSLLSLKNALGPGGSDDDNTRLLSAIKPFLNDKRKPQVDSLLKLLKLANVAQKAGAYDILKNLKL